MSNKVYLDSWSKEGDKVRLIYKDGESICVKADDFNRAFGCIVSGEKQAIIRDFAI